MSTISESEGLATLINFLIGGTASTADAANAAWQAFTSRTPAERTLGGVSASADVVGIGASTGQMLSQFAANSPEAGALLGCLAEEAGQVGLVANFIGVLNTAREGGAGSITSGQLDAVAGAALAVGAVAAAPEAAIALGVLAAGMTVLGLADQSSSHTISNALKQLRSIIEPYVDKLPASAKEAFTASFTHTVHSALSGDAAAKHTESKRKPAMQIWGIDTYGNVDLTAVKNDGSGIYAEQWLDERGYECRAPVRQPKNI